MVPAFHYFPRGNNKPYVKRPIPSSLHELFLLCFQMPRALLCNILSNYERFSFFHFGQSLMPETLCVPPVPPGMVFSLWARLRVIQAQASSYHLSPPNIPGTTPGRVLWETRAKAELKMQIAPALMDQQKE